MGLFRPVMGQFYLFTLFTDHRQHNLCAHFLSTSKKTVIHKFLETGYVKNFGMIPFLLYKTHTIEQSDDLY